MGNGTGPVLVTGAFGNVGRETLRALLARGRRVVATDLRTPVTEKAAREFAGRVDVRWADLARTGTVEGLLSDVGPGCVLHLAAIIPPGTYRNLPLARAVNVDATARLVDAASEQPRPPRLVLASSVAVYGSRNPHTVDGPVTAATSVAPREQYGAHKVEAEQLLRASSLEWVILRLGVVLFPDAALSTDRSAVRMEALLPSDGRVHAVDGRDVGVALAASVDATCAGRTLLVAGDESTRMTQRELAHSVTAALGLRGAIPPGRAGDPNDDDAWFNVDWMDTTEAEELLSFQQHTWGQTLAALRADAGRIRHVLPLLTPAARFALRRGSPYRGVPEGPADPWGGIAREFGADALV